MTKSSLLLSCTVAATAAVALWFWTEWRQERLVNLDLAGRRQNTALQCREVAAVAPAPISNAPAPTSTRAKMPVIDAQATMPALPPGFRPGLEPRFLKNPEFRKALLAQQRVMVEETYRDLPKFLGLSAAKADQLLDLLAEQRVKSMEAQWKKPEEGKTVADSVQELRARNDAELANLLGASDAIRVHEFRSTMESRVEVDSVRNELARGSEPLRQDQIDPLLGVVNTELQRLDEEVRNLGEVSQEGPDPAADKKRIDLTVAANQRILENARPILSSEQLAGLQDLYRRQRQQMEAQNELSRLRRQSALGDSENPK